jgi:hypothetical protein
MTNINPNPIPAVIKTEKDIEESGMLNTLKTNNNG